MGPNGDTASVLSDPLWTAALPLAEEATRRIEGDLQARRVALTEWRRLGNRASRDVLTIDLVSGVRASGDLEPYPHARGLLTRLSKDGIQIDQGAISSSLAKQSAMMEKDIGDRRAALRMWSRLRAALEAGQPQLAQRILADERMSSSAALYSDLDRNLSRIQIAVRRMLERGLKVLQDAITQYASDRHLPLAMRDRRFVLDHLVTIELAEDRTTRVQARRVRSLSWDVVRPVIDTEYDRVWGRARRGPDEFRQELDTILAAHAGGHEHVRLRDVYEAIEKARPKTPGRLAAYYRDEFSADLSVLLSTESGRRFEFSAIRDPRLAFPVVLPDGSLQQYGFVRLRGEG